MGEQDVLAVVVGGGPVGLLWAMLLAHKCSIEQQNKKIVVMEKRREYTRHNKIKLNSLDDLIKVMPSAEDLIRNLWRKIVSATGDGKSPGENKRVWIEICELERILSGAAQEAGVQIIYEEYKDETRIKERFPNCKAVFMAGGAKFPGSKEKSSKTDNMEYIVKIIYKSKNSREHSWLTEEYPFQKLSPFFVQQTVGAADSDGKQNITIMMFVNKEAYNYVSTQTENLDKGLAVGWGLFAREECPEQLKKAVQLSLGFRKKICYDSGIENVAVSCFALNAYNNGRPTHTHEGIMHCKIGDAQQGFPFRQGLNTHVQTMVKLGKRYEYSLDQMCNNSDFEAVYEKISKSTYEKVAFKCRVMDFFLAVWSLFLRISNIVPWQVNKYSRADTQDFVEIGNGIINQREQGDGIKQETTVLLSFDKGLPKIINDANIELATPNVQHRQSAIL